MEQGTEIAIRLLAAGYAVSRVAETLQCDEDTIEAVQDAYAHQIEEAADEIGSTPAAPAAVERPLTHDERIDAAEAHALEKVSNMLPMETNIVRAAKLFQILNSAKRRDSGEGLAPGTHVTVDNRQVVYLDVPDHMRRKPDYTTNAQNEVVAVEGRPLAIASSKQVNSLAGILQEADDTLLETEHETEAVLIDDGQAPSVSQGQAQHST